MKKKLIYLVMALGIVAWMLILNRTTKPVIAELCTDESGDTYFIKCNDSNNTVLYGYEMSEAIHFYIPSYLSQEALTLPEDDNFVFHTSENVPTLRITMEEESKRNIDEDHYENARVEIIDDKGSKVYDSQDQALIKGRGNASWYADKKSFSLSLPHKVPLLGMSNSKKWVLLSNAYDSTNLQNKLTFDLAREINDKTVYAPDSRWVDLYLNGEYKGNYLLTEKIDVAENKLDIGNLEDVNEVANVDLNNLITEDGVRGFYADHDLSQDVMTGGYIVERDIYEGEYPGFSLAGKYNFNLIYPDNATFSQAKYIKSILENVDNIIRNNKDVSEYVDVDSFINKFLVEEFACNYDTNVTSCFFYKKQGDIKIYAGPVWDFDNAYGNSSKAEWTNYDKGILDHRRDEALDWDDHLFENSEFRAALKEKYIEIRPILVRIYQEDIDAFTEQFGMAMQMDCDRWPPDDVGGGHFKNYENNIRYLKFFIYHRIHHLDQLFDLEYDELDAPEKRKESHVMVFAQEIPVVFEVEDGECVSYEMLESYGVDTDVEWRHEGNDIQFSPYVPVYEDVVYIIHED